MKKQIVVARFKEDVSWIHRTSVPSVIYDKRYTYPNTGREATTYLFHIITKYDELADVTIFSQGDPFRHSPLFLELVEHDFSEVTSLAKRGAIVHFGKNYDNDIVQKFHDTTIRYCVRRMSNDTQYGDLPLRDAWEYLFATPPPAPDKTITFAYSAHLAVPKKYIRMRSLNFWYRCFVWCEANRINRAWSAYVFESLWLYVFDPNIKERTDPAPRLAIWRIYAKYLIVMVLKRILHPLIKRDFLGTPDVSRCGIKDYFKYQFVGDNYLFAYWRAIHWRVIADFFNPFHKNKS